VGQAAHDDGHFEHCPWLFAAQASDDQHTAQSRLQTALAAGGTAEIGERCFIAASAAVYPDRLRLGSDSYIAAHAYVTGEIHAGSDCTLNPFTTVRGTVRLGDGVRIGAHSSLLGFNHATAIERPIHRQPQTSRGINVGDDVWIGSHVVVLDGVTIGDHCIIGAGAVVTKDIPAWSVAVGNPARVIRDRRHATPAPITRPPGGQAGGLDEDLAGFAAVARDQAAALIARCWDPDAPAGGRYLDRPAAAPTVRAHCDAIEIADLLLGEAPEQLTAGEHIARLQAMQDSETGLIAQLDPAIALPRPLPPPDADGFISDGDAQYHVLCVGYALDLLGGCLPHPISPVRRMTAEQLVDRLNRLPWQERVWHAGSWIDSWATAAHWNLAHGGGPMPGALEALFGWLLTRADPLTGMWGTPSADGDRLQVVNGYYRLTRGSFAQYGLPVPHPEQVIDAVLDHARNPGYFGAGRENACNVLDVAHPLWLCARQTGHRADEAQAWAERQLAATLPRWRDGCGFAFGPALEGAGPGREAGLQGTEMWLAVVWLLADLAGRADLLGYRPRGVHRPEPARANRAGTAPSAHPLCAPS
jgi:acetyltransferase-like isoleucine patch superfamily enzyme